jgi:multidrug efflux pump subunit AcrA (membrane-fusion protein)
VRYISPDALSERTAQGEAIFYRVQIEIDSDALQARNQVQPSKPIEIQPGMTSTVEIVTGTQTVLAYLTKPVTKTLSDSLGER